MRGFSGAWLGRKLCRLYGIQQMLYGFAVRLRAM